MPRHPFRRIVTSLALALAAVLNPLGDRDVLPPPTTTAATMLDATPPRSDATPGQIAGARHAEQQRGGDQGLGPDFPLPAPLDAPIDPSRSITWSSVGGTTVTVTPADDQVPGGVTVTMPDGRMVTIMPPPADPTILPAEPPHRLDDTLERLYDALDKATSLASTGADLLEKQPHASQSAEHVDGRSANE